MLEKGATGCESSTNNPDWCVKFNYCSNSLKFLYVENRYVVETPAQASEKKILGADDIEDLCVEESDGLR